jgi:hypothetical protein
MTVQRVAGRVRIRVTNYRVPMGHWSDRATTLVSMMPEIPEETAHQALERACQQVLQDLAARHLRHVHNTCGGRDEAASAPTLGIDLAVNDHLRDRVEFAQGL